MEENRLDDGKRSAVGVTVWKVRMRKEQGGSFLICI